MGLGLEPPLELWGPRWARPLCSSPQPHLALSCIANSPLALQTPWADLIAPQHPDFPAPSTTRAPAPRARPGSSSALVQSTTARARRANIVGKTQKGMTEAISCLIKELLKVLEHIPAPRQSFGTLEQLLRPSRSPELLGAALSLKHIEMSGKDKRAEISDKNSQMTAAQSSELQREQEKWSHSNSWSIIWENKE